MRVREERVFWEPTSCVNVGTLTPLTNTVAPAVNPVSVRAANSSANILDSDYLYFCAVVRPALSPRRTPHQTSIQLVTHALGTAAPLVRKSKIAGIRAVA